ncbi:MAG: ABC transporter ATP-binding protein, partial [Acidimicrobiia bacterium]|nr:ABC transporter ATP-binding protein [Acidimicrobiia bacterium]
MTEHASTGKALRRLLAEVPALRRGLWGTIALAILGTALHVAIPVVVQQILDVEILDPDGVDVRGTAIRGSIAAVAMLAAVVARRSSTLRLASMSAYGLSDLRVKVFARLHSMSA